MKDLKQLLLERFDGVDFENAKNNVLGFVRNPRELDLWSKDFFISVTVDYFNAFS